MSKKNNSVAKEKLKGATGFQEYYSQLYQERWPQLQAALLAEKDDLKWQVPGAEQPYFLDKGSVVAALSLPTEGAANILDLCAAPGGKTIVLSSMMEESARLLANERSSERVQRLRKVIKDCTSEEIKERIQVICSDGAKLCLKNNECFDRILLDAPCSSERHVLSSLQHLNQWSPSRIKSLAITQWALLSSAYRMLKPQGFLLYATCSLCPAENDEIVAKLQKKFEGVEYQKNIPQIPEKAYSFFSETLPTAEQTDFGFHILPDKANGAGPLYFCLIKKTV